jgi:hypothetical protein
VPFRNAAKSFDEQVLHAVSLVRERRFIHAAAVIARLPDVEHVHISCVLTELEKGHTHNAIVALELIQDVYRAAPRPCLRLVAAGKSLT